MKIIIKIAIVILLLVAGVTIISAAPVTKSTIAPTYPAEITSQKISALSQVKVVSVYEPVTDGTVRSTSNMITIFNDTKTNLIFRGFFRWGPVPESPDASVPGYSSSYVSGKAKIGYTYQQLGDTLNQIKAAKPDILFVGAIAAQRLNKIEVNDKTGESFTQSQTWAMALDPAKFNLKYTKVDFQCIIAKAHGWVDASAGCPSGYDPATVPAYFPDITNDKYQILLLSYAQKQIDLGADAIWIDMLYSQANYLAQMAGNPNDPAAKASYDASSSIIDKIHEYGLTKYGKHIYVGTWTTFFGLPYSAPDVDFVTASPTSQEIKSGLISSKWNSLKNAVNKKVGNVPIYVFIDWNSTAASPMGVFSQSLTKAQQSAWLIKADEFFTKNGIVFMYPVHGGTFPMSSKSLSFGKYNVYDSLAPQFDTYGTIKSLAQKKSANRMING